MNYQAEVAALHFKDESLDHLAETANIAQFISFAPDSRQRFSRVLGFPPNHMFGGATEAIQTLLIRSPEKSVNVRSFQPDHPKSSEFRYALTSADETLAHVLRMARTGLYTIVNETIDVHDGGVSGVVIGDTLEFAPDSTPRCVDHDGVAALPRNIGLHALETVYGWRAALNYVPDQRVEFSLHPLKRGYLGGHTVVWEIEKCESLNLHPLVSWPNLFSRFLGDKTYGLLVAAGFGLLVPSTTVISRRVAPFHFGQATGTGEFWIRTCPMEQQPGRFTTHRGWEDPFELLRRDDPTGGMIASVLSQEGVESRYSGSLIVDADGNVLIEGVEGRGDRFMLAEQAPIELPAQVRKAVGQLYLEAATELGPVRIEWVFDGSRVWVVQLHVGATKSRGMIVYPGDATSLHRFAVGDGIAALYSLVSRVEGTGEGIVLVGNIGVTSHMGDILRRARIPSRIELDSIRA